MISPVCPRVSWAALALLTLSACGSSTPTPAPEAYTVQVRDGQYGIDFAYTTSREFSYAGAALPGYTESLAEAQMLTLVNEERGRGGTCPVRGGGQRTYGPARPLEFEGHLHRAATDYARELAASGSLTLTHRSALTGLVPSQRVVNAAYRPLPPNGAALAFDESLAAELLRSDPAGVVAAWKTSPEHCAALYEPMLKFGHGAVGRVEVRVGGQAMTYWVLNTAGY